MPGFAAQWAHRVVPRFADPVLERSYRIEQRTRQAWFTVRMIVFGTIGILAYWIFALIALGPRTAWGIVSQQGMLLPILLIYTWLVRRPSYAHSPAADIFLYSAIQPSLYTSIAPAISARPVGWSFNAQLCFSLILTMAFACLNFTAAVGAFFLLVVASIVYLAIVLTLAGFPSGVVLFTVQDYTFYAVVIVFLNLAMDRKARSMFAARVELSAEREKSDRLLTNMLPVPVAERLKSREAVADTFDDIVVVFIDLVGFTPLSQRLGPARIVELLNAFFERADHGTDLFGLEKVKTIGDAYMAVAGAIVPTPRPAKAAIDFAVWLRGEALRVGRGFDCELRLHVGIASGPAIGGVTGSKRFSYDYWGSTVNLAARLQDSVGADGIAVSAAVRGVVGDSYPFRPSRSVMLKGLGATTVYDLDLAAE